MLRCNRRSCRSLSVHNAFETVHLRHSKAIFHLPLLISSQHTTLSPVAGNLSVKFRQMYSLFLCVWILTVLRLARRTGKVKVFQSHQGSLLPVSGVLLHSDVPYPPGLEMPHRMLQGNHSHIFRQNLKVHAHVQQLNLYLL